MKQLSKLASHIDEELAKLNFPDNPRGLYEPFIYTLGLGGKRLRPSLVLLACEMFGGHYRDAMSPALGIELFHNFTLLHDDIMDEAKLRRGHPSVYEKFGRNTAILSGDVMMVRAYNLVSQAGGANASHIMHLFNKTAEEVCIGQQYDMEFEDMQNVSLSDYINMISLKTAVLLGCSLQTGALVAGANDDNARRIYEFGRLLGVAFQLRDDVLDTYGDPGKFGKMPGGDIARNKKTFLLIRALEKANVAQKQTLDTWLNHSADPHLNGVGRHTDVSHDEQKIAAIMEIYDELDVRLECEEQMNNYYQKALNQLREIPSKMTAESKRDVLLGLASELMHRQN